MLKYILSQEVIIMARNITGVLGVDIGKVRQ